MFAQVSNVQLGSDEDGVGKWTPPKPMARAPVDRGLLEYVKEMGRYQMHALLVMHAKSLLTPE